MRDLVVIDTADMDHAKQIAAPAVDAADPLDPAQLPHLRFSPSIAAIDYRRIDVRFVHQRT